MNSYRREIRDKRIMRFTSLLRTLNYVSHARVEQCHSLFVKYEEKHPISEMVNSQHDHKQVREWLVSLKD